MKIIKLDVANSNDFILFKYLSKITYAPWQEKSKITYAGTLSDLQVREEWQIDKLIPHKTSIEYQIG